MLRRKPTHQRIQHQIPIIEIALHNQSESSEKTCEDRNESIAAAKVKSSLCVALLGV
jgi:hypothetical protein